MKIALLLWFLAFVQTAPNTQTKPRLDFINLGKSRLLLVRIPSGEFWMGTNQVFTAAGNWTNEVERPVHQVTISKDFWMGQFPVTQQQWQEVMGDNPSYFQHAGPDAPVEQVNWNQVQAFLAKLNASQSKWKVRLPTEAEWEYAARGLPRLLQVLEGSSQA
jgi:formylglycine-generating enzyme required for sulfatase activity